MESFIFRIAEQSLPIAVLIAMFIIILFLLYKINTQNIEKVKDEMLDNANKIKVGVDIDVALLKENQNRQSTNFDEMKLEVHRISTSMNTTSNKIDNVAHSVREVNHTLELISIQLGASAMDAIKSKIKKGEE